MTLEEIKSYFQYYLFENLGKKLLIFSIVAFLADFISLNSLVCFSFHFFQYLSVYFFNDYIDRKEDKKRKYIAEGKLVLREKILLKLSILHFIVPLIFILIFYGIKIAILSSSIVIFGVLRSFAKNRTLREISLGFLQFIQIFFFFVLLGNINIFVEYIFLIILYCLFYSFAYYVHKTPEYGEEPNKTFSYFLVFFTILILALSDVNNFKSLLSIVSISIANFTIYFIFLGKMTVKNFKLILKSGAFSTLLIALLLLSLVSLSNYNENLAKQLNSELVLKKTEKNSFLIYEINTTVKETLKYILELYNNITLKFNF